MLTLLLPSPLQGHARYSALEPLSRSFRFRNMSRFWCVQSSVLYQWGNVCASGCAACASLSACVVRVVYCPSGVRAHETTGASSTTLLATVPSGRCSIRTLLGKHSCCEAISALVTRTPEHLVWLSPSRTNTGRVPQLRPCCRPPLQERAGAV